ncbi:MAG: SDR family NAD(P)-dependent oxidoreductase [Gammaproteobacteria bacterium]
MTTTNAVLISGASTGIGRASALRLDRAGWRVFAGVRRAEDGETLKAEGTERLTPVILDVTQAQTIDGVHQELRAAVGHAGLAGLVNNAGIAIGGPVEVVSLDEYREAMEVNYFGHIAVTQKFLPMVRKARGRIVYTGSVGGKISNAWCHQDADARPRRFDQGRDTRIDPGPIRAALSRCRESRDRGLPRVDEERIGSRCGGAADRARVDREKASHTLSRRCRRKDERILRVAAE